jgi:cobalt-zinc-cadmium resistance protein CzcA
MPASTTLSLYFDPLQGASASDLVRRAHPLPDRHRGEDVQTDGADGSLRARGLPPALTHLRPGALTFLLRGHVSEEESFVIRYARRKYRAAFIVVGRYRAQALAIAVALVAASGVVFRTLGSEFIPRLDEGALAIEARVLPSVSLTQSVETYSQAERVLRRFPEMMKVVTKIGRAEVATDPMSVDAADVYIELKPPSEWTSARTREELVEKMSAALTSTACARRGGLCRTP